MADDAEELELEPHPVSLRQVISPVDGGVVAEFADVSDDGGVMARAAQVQVEWAARSVRQRARRIAALGEALVAQFDALVDLIVRETSKAPIEALAAEPPDHALYLSQHAELILGRPGSTACG